MAIINNATKEIVCKIVYYGAALGGKTTNLRAIHEMLPGKRKGELISLATQQDRTLFFDFMPLELGDIQGFNTKISLYTVPGQVFYNATRQLVLRGVDGIVFVVDSQEDRLEVNIDSLENMCENLSFYGYDVDEIPVVMQYNKRDLDASLPVETLQQKVNFIGFPHFESIATDGEGVRETLKGIASRVLQKIEAMNPEQTMLEKAAKTFNTSVASTSDTAEVESDPGFEETEQKAVSVAEPAREGESSVADAKEEDNEKPEEEPAAHDNVPRVNLQQIGNIFWKGFKIGKAKVRFDVQNDDTSCSYYKLDADCKIMLLFRYRAQKTIRLERSILVNIEGKEQRFFLFRNNGTRQEEIPFENHIEDITLWVKESNISAPMYTRFTTTFGDFYFVPEGDETFFKYLV